MTSQFCKNLLQMIILFIPGFQIVPLLTESRHWEARSCLHFAVFSWFFVRVIEGGIIPTCCFSTCHQVFPATFTTLTWAVEQWVGDWEEEGICTLGIPLSTFGLLLGGCRLGIELLVYATLHLPSMHGTGAEGARHCGGVWSWWYCRVPDSCPEVLLT